MRLTKESPNNFDKKYRNPNAVTKRKVNAIMTRTIKYIDTNTTLARNI